MRGFSRTSVKCRFKSVGSVGAIESVVVAVMVAVAIVVVEVPPVQPGFNSIFPYKNQEDGEIIFRSKYEKEEACG